MVTTFIFIVSHFLLSLLFFIIVQKPLFFLYNRRVCKERITFAQVMKTVAVGVKTDSIAAAYLTGLPLIVLLLLSFIPGIRVVEVLVGCDVLLSLAVSAIVVPDTVLYRFWQYKLESSVMSYLRHPKGAFASVSILFVALGIIVLLAVAAVYFVFVSAALYLAFGNDGTLGLSGIWQHILVVPEILVMAACLFVVIRGLGVRPNNPAKAYFSGVQFLNHCALNPIYNFIYSFSVADKYANDCRYFSTDECAKEFEGLFPTEGKNTRELLRTKRPDILLIVWESLSYRFLGCLGGESGVMENFDRLAGEGVLFTRCDCGSFRTDRGLACVLSGLPGQPTESVIKHTRLLPKLPAFPRVLRDAGYDTMALHGGDCFIMHKADYYLTAGHTTLMDEKNLPDIGLKNRWGYHDGPVFDWLYSDIQRKTAAGRPWFTTFQTLSSHEPFEVPFNKFTDKIKNSYAYSDDCFGRFIDKLKASPAWDNLLVVVTGDHGFNSSEVMERGKYPHIPVLMLGGAVKQPVKIDKIMAQTDIAATLLGQLGLPHGEFKFSRDVLADTYTYPFSLHTYNNGFLFRDETGFTVFDNVSGKPLENPDPHREHMGKVILQTVYEYLSKL